MTQEARFMAGAPPLLRQKGPSARIARFSHRTSEAEPSMFHRLPAALVAAGVGLAALAPAAYAQKITGNAAAGKEKASMCFGCHGIVGYRTAYPEVYPVPKIGGQQDA